MIIEYLLEFITDNILTLIPDFLVDLPVLNTLPYFDYIISFFKLATWFFPPLGIFIYAVLVIMYGRLLFSVARTIIEFVPFF